MAEDRDFSRSDASDSPAETPMADIAERVRSARNEHGWSQNELAERAGVSRPSIARIEGGHDGNTNVLNKVLKVLGLALDIRDDD